MCDSSVAISAHNTSVKKTASLSTAHQLGPFIFMLKCFVCLTDIFQHSGGKCYHCQSSVLPTSDIESCSPFDTTGPLIENFCKHTSELTTNYLYVDQDISHPFQIQNLFPTKQFKVQQGSFRNSEHLDIQPKCEEKMRTLGSWVLRFCFTLLMALQLFVISYHHTTIRYTLAITMGAPVATTNFEEETYPRYDHQLQTIRDTCFRFLDHLFLPSRLTNIQKQDETLHDTQIPIYDVQASNHDAPKLSCRGRWNVAYLSHIWFCLMLDTLGISVQILSENRVHTVFDTLDLIYSFALVSEYDINVFPQNSQWIKQHEGGQHGFINRQDLYCPFAHRWRITNSNHDTRSNLKYFMSFQTAFKRFPEQHCKAWVDTVQHGLHASDIRYLCGRANLVFAHLL